MVNLLSLEDFLSESKLNFTQEQINECLNYLNSNDEQLLEAWYNTLLDFAALIPGIGSIAEGINLVSYAKQGEYLLAALCAIGVIPIFGQYIGAGGTLLIKTLGKGTEIGKGILKPLINLVAKFFPKIVNFFRSPKFTSKFNGIGPYIEKMINSLKQFVMGGGEKIKDLAKNPARIKELKSNARKMKTGVKLTKLLFGGSSKGNEENYQIPVPKDSYLSYQGVPLQNIRPYTDMEIAQAENVPDWANAYLG